MYHSMFYNSTFTLGYVVARPLSSLKIQNSSVEDHCQEKHEEGNPQNPASCIPALTHCKAVTDAPGVS